MVEQWDEELLRRSTDHLEAGLKGFTADSTSETRALGRQGCAAYVAKLPDRGEALLRKLDPSLREKLAGLLQRGGRSPAGGRRGRGGGRGLSGRRWQAVGQACTMICSAKHAQAQS
jgi:hypothetical protein